MIIADTQLLIFAAVQPERLSQKAREYLEDTKYEIWFSAASIWEIAIKFSLRKPGFQIDPRSIADNCRDIGFRELAITTEHTIDVASLPDLHSDPFDRLLVSQARVESLRLITTDKTVAKYGKSVELV